MSWPPGDWVGGMMGWVLDWGARRLMERVLICTQGETGLTISDLELGAAGVRRQPLLQMGLWGAGDRGVICQTERQAHNRATAGEPDRLVR